MWNEILPFVFNAESLRVYWLINSFNLTIVSLYTKDIITSKTAEINNKANEQKHKHYPL